MSKTKPLIDSNVINSEISCRLGGHSVDNVIDALIDNIFEDVRVSIADRILERLLERLDAPDAEEAS